MSSTSVVRSVSAVLFLCLVAAGIATVAGVANAGLAGATLVGLAAVVTGADHVTDPSTSLEVAGGAVLAAAGLWGVLVGLGGENPLGRWDVLVPLAVGLALATVGDEDADLPLAGMLGAGGVE